MYDVIAPLYNGQQLEIDQVTDGVTVHITVGVDRQCYSYMASPW